MGEEMAELEALKPLPRPDTDGRPEPGPWTDSDPKPDAAAEPKPEVGPPCWLAVVPKEDEGPAEPKPDAELCAERLPKPLVMGP